MRIALLLSIAAAPTAFAQSYNVDIGMNLGAFAPTPSDFYGAAAGQPGHWQAFFPSLTPVALEGLDGAPTTATLRSDSTSTFNVFPGVMPSGDDQHLMEDFHLTPNLNTPSIWTFEGLEDGSYTLYCYASDPTSVTVTTRIDVSGSSDPAQDVGAGWPGAHAFGQTYSRHDVSVAGGTLVFSATVVGDQFDSGVLNGLQLVFNGGLGIEFCQSNPNSTGVNGELTAAGSATAASNDLTLTASSLPANAFGFFLTSRQSGFVANPAGSEGNLCVAGAIGRYVGPGQIQQSGAGGTFSLQLDLTMTPQPNGFVSVMPGETWYYQAWHRDTSAGGQATSNFTDGLEIDFL